MTIEVDLVGQKVDILRLDTILGLNFRNDSELSIEADVFVTLPSGRVTVVDRRTEEALRPLLHVVLHTVDSARVTTEGGLELALEGGVRLRVLPSPTGRAWTFETLDGGRISSEAGGRIERTMP